MVDMAREWVLDLDPSGTGAEMRPLDSVLRKPEPKPDLAQVRRKPQPRPEPAPEPRKPRRFKVVDVMTRQVLAEDVSVRPVLELLGETRSVVDVVVYVWDREGQDWRPLTMREQKLLWAEREGQAAARSAKGSDSPVS